MSKPSFLLNYGNDEDLKEWFEANKNHKTEYRGQICPRRFPAIAE